MLVEIFYASVYMYKNANMFVKSFHERLTKWVIGLTENCYKK